MSEGRFYLQLYPHLEMSPSSPEHTPILTGKIVIKIVITVTMEAAGVIPGLGAGQQQQQRGAELCSQRHLGFPPVG